MELQNINFKGKNYKFIGDIQSADGSTSMYKAKAVDDSGEKFEVIWKTTDEWEDALLDGLAETEYDINQACDWDHPLMVKQVSEENYVQ